MKHREPPTPPLAPGVTLFNPRGELPSLHSARETRGLPPDLREQATQRLRIVAIVYSLGFFFADLVPAVVSGHAAEHFAYPSAWIPTVASIAAGLLFAALISSPRLGWDTKVNLGLVFQVIGSYGIALAMYLNLDELAPGSTRLPNVTPAWTAIWMIFYSIVVPAPPGRALIAQLASASAPPLIIWLEMRQSHLLHLIPPFHYFLFVGLPQLICVAMAWVGARTVYQLGRAVTRARELGSYQLIERLGHGGMGEVWRARHQLLAREAAIKFIHPESIAGASPEAARALLRRFELEARATASLTSEHTIDIYDFGVTDDGTFYYVMELLEGLDGDDLVRRFGPLPAGRVVHLLRQLCESLEEAHAKGLIHRDVKPANLYVCRAGMRRDVVKVLDFGLVAERRAVTEAASRLTQAEQAIGTPHYMPPEMALGQPIDARADLYGIGCVGYWLATGRPVFDGATYYEIVSKHMHQPPDPPSRHVAGGLPAELDAVILSCLEKDPARRPAGAHELGRRLTRLAAAEPWLDEQAEEWWRGIPEIVARADAARAVPRSPLGAPT